MSISLPLSGTGAADSRQQATDHSFVSYNIMIINKKCFSFALKKLFRAQIAIY